MNYFYKAVVVTLLPWVVALVVYAVYRVVLEIQWRRQPVDADEDRQRRERSESRAVYGILLLIFVRTFVIGVIESRSHFRAARASRAAISLACTSTAGLVERSSGCGILYVLAIFA